MDELERVRADNIAKIVELKNQWNHILAPDGVLLTRINTLVDLLVPEKNRKAFELAFEKAISANLDEALEIARSASTRTRLLQGVPGVVVNRPSQEPL